MAQNNFVQVRNLTTNVIHGTIKIIRNGGNTEELVFNDIYANGNVSEWITVNNLDSFTCQVHVEGAPHVGVASADLTISGGANAYLMLDVTQNGYVNMFASSQAANAPIR